MSVTDCLIPIVGLSNTECPCHSAAGVVDYQQGTSSEYIDDTEHCVTLNFPLTEIDCESSDIWALLTRARSKGVTNFIASYLQHLNSTMTNKFSGYSDHVGQRPSNFYALNTLTVSDTAVGFYWTPTIYKGVYQHIDKVYLTINTVGTYTVNLINTDEPDVVLHSVDIVVTKAGVRKGVDFNYRVSLEDINRPVVYALYYERTSEKPYNVKFSCGCGSDPAWMKRGYMVPRGFKIDDITALDIDTLFTSDYTHGLEVDYSFQCSALDWLCNQGDEFWTETEYGILAAKLIAKFSANWLMSAILGNQPNPYTVINSDYMLSKIESNTEVINDIMPILVQNSNDMTHCYTCKNSGFMKLEKNYF
jgi:hypothetical protein